jgi:hypothetical protein
MDQVSEGESTQPVDSPLLKDIAAGIKASGEQSQEGPEQHSNELNHSDAND